MRLTRLLLIALLVLIAGKTAASQDSKAPTNKSDYVRPFAPSNSNSIRPSVSANGIDYPSASHRALPKGKSWLVEDFQNQNDTCLALHTLVVARDAQHSDATHLVSQRDCTPARQFQTKSAVTVPADQK